MVPVTICTWKTPIRMIRFNQHTPLVLFCRTQANSADADQNAASDQGLYCMFTECSIND